MVRLFAGGLPRSATTETLRAIFGPDEGMTNCVAIRGRDGRCRGFGFASFANADAAAAAAEVPRTLDGRSVYLLPEKTAVVPAAPPPAANSDGRFDMDATTLRPHLYLPKDTHQHVTRC